MPIMKPGPKTEPFLERTRARTLSLDDLTVTMAEALGEGNASKGVRAAVRFAYDLYQADRFTPGTRNAVPVVPKPRAPLAAGAGGSQSPQPEPAEQPPAPPA